VSNLVPFNSVANVAERGHHVMAVRGFNKDPRSAVAIGDRRPMAPTFVPGVYDPRVNRQQMPSFMPTGTTAADIRTGDRMKDAVRDHGVMGTRCAIPHPSRGPRGVASVVPTENTPAAALLAMREAQIGQFQQIGSPVTAMSSAAEAQMRYGGACPETGARQVRRVTDDMGGCPTSIQPGASGRRTAGLTLIRGGALPLPGTPMMAGGTAIVDGAPPPGFGVPLAVGTESFGSAASTGGMLVAQPDPMRSVPVARPGGQQLYPADYGAMFPGYQAPGKGGTPSGPAPLIQTSAGAIPVPVEAPRANYGAVALAVVAFYLLARSR
jgi:hypothetical protein